MKVFPTRTVLLFLGIGVIINLILLNWWVFTKNTSDKKIQIESAEKILENSLTQEVIQKEDLTCPTSCITRINEATSSVSLATNTTTVNNIVANNGVKEFFVPLGAGSNSSSDWQNVAGAQAYIDSSQYGQIKSVTFEASVNIPTGNQTVYVRLFNSTAGHPVWFSDVSLSGGTPQLLISSPITLDSGNNSYQVQMKTQLQYTALLEQSRVHITLY